MSENARNSESERALSSLIAVMLGGLIGIFLYSFTSSSVAEFFSFAIIGSMVSGASLFIGGLLGFLFGIPRTSEQEKITGSSQIANQNDLENPTAKYEHNTNLEQISDWLTKILVGVGLTQISKIPGKFYHIAELISNGLGKTSGAQIFALSTILFFGICGFLFVYLWTRLYLPRAFRNADLSVLVRRVDKANSEVQQVNQEVKEVNKKLRDLEKQSELDAISLSFVQRQLNPSIDIPPVTQGQLNEAIKAASHSVRVQIFNQAQNMRSENWKSNKVKMELVIPILKALIASDTENKFHRNHAQLGYAYKDQIMPDWVAAESELTTAINMRGSWRKNGWLFYEFNRAICRINQDDRFMQKLESETETRAKILDDLSAVATNHGLKKLMIDDASENVIHSWMVMNKTNEIL